MKQSELRDFLNEKVLQYNGKDFIETDPVQIPHRFQSKEDQEISGFLTATISWGNRKSILTNAHKLMEMMDQSPYEFILHHQNKDLKSLESFVHRTFNGVDLQYFIKSLQNIYKNHSGLEVLFAKNLSKNSTQPAIAAFKKIFFELPHPQNHKTH